MRRLSNLKKNKSVAVRRSQTEDSLCLSFETSSRTITRITWSRTLAIFGPFLEPHDFFENRGLTFEMSDLNFCDLLNEHFYLALTLFLKTKIKF